MVRAELRDLAAFVAIADELSFRTAAERLGVTPSALSHTIRELEGRHGVRLFNRTTRKVALTSAGERLLARLRPALDEISGAVQALDQERQRPFGRLALLVVPSAMPSVITPVWARYLAAYPDVRLELSVDSSPHDILADSFDAAIGLLEWAAADMIAVRVTSAARGVFVASPAYIARRGAPRALEDLERHSCIRYRGADGALVDWRAEQKGRRFRLDPPARVVVSDPLLAFQAAADGLGVAFGSDRLAEPYLRSGQLARVLELWAPDIEGLYLFYPGHRHVPAALRALINMIRVGA
ncbi:MAG TPA: LysR family transcriptional regulator [Caulobacteraceae bacterium]|nr:LysR family transcriptional regulator [Caulobacteraceae bacterium]